MPDWTKSMEQTYEYYIVDPGTWQDKAVLSNVKPGATITRDLEAETLGSATIDVVESVGECYIRIYLVTIQNGVRERHPLATVLVQTPSSSFDGKVRSITMDAYTPLIELKENPTPLGYSILKDSNIMDNAYRLVRDNVRAPVIEPTCPDTLYRDFVANTEDKWITYIRDLIANARYEFGLDELGRIIFLPKQELESLQPIWTYDDGDNSILFSDITMTHDLYGVPNVLEVMVTSGYYNPETQQKEYYIRIVNDDPDSPISTVNRGREIVHRSVNPNISGSNGMLTKDVVESYATSLLKDLSSVQYSVSYTHAYCPVRLGDCVRINYTRAGLNNVKAKVISQTIKCQSGCSVAEKAVFTTKLWR